MTKSSHEQIATTERSSLLKSPIVNTKTKDKILRTFDGVTMTSFLVRPTDFLCGKHGFCQEHGGTTFVREQCVIARLEEYHDAEKSGKEAINIEIVLQVYGRGGRFLEYEKKNGTWSACGFVKARQKVGSLFRSMRRRVTPTTNEQKHADDDLLEPLPVIVTEEGLSSQNLDLPSAEDLAVLLAVGNDAPSMDELLEQDEEYQKEALDREDLAYGIL